MEASDDFLTWEDLSPAVTGLPMMVWINSKNDRLLIATSYGTSASLAESAMVGVRPKPHLIRGLLAPVDEQVVFAWIKRNTDILLAYWNGEIDIDHLSRNLKPG